MIIKNSSVNIRKENVPKLTPVANLEHISEKVNSLHDDNLNEEVEMEHIESTSDKKRISSNTHGNKDDVNEKVNPAAAYLKTENMQRISKSPKKNPKINPLKPQKNNKPENNLELKWDNITIETKVNNSSCCNKKDFKPKQLLKDVSGFVRSGQALAIIGGSGAGKTTFLNFLSKKIETSRLNCSGKITLNGVEILNSEDSPTSKKENQAYFLPSDFESISAYVMQDDVLEPTMTPLEIILFTGKLKLNIPEKDIEERVFKLLKMLNIKNCKNTKIGDTLHRGVSGGERKRTSIAVELISDPKILFLDEPTTGLDSYNSYQLVENLCQLAISEQKIVIFTIHQPSSEVYQLLDNIFILADGRTVYFGDVEHSVDFFDGKLQIPFPENYNPFEYFIEMTNFEILNNEKIKSIKAYADILNKVDYTNSESKQKGYSAFIALLSDIFSNRKKLIYKKDQKGFIAVDKDPQSCWREEVYEAVDPQGNVVYERDEKYTKVKSNGMKELQLNGNSFYSDDTKAYLDEIIIKKKKTKGFCYEFSMLIQKGMLLSIRNPKVLLFKLSSSIVQGFLIGILFKNMTKSYSGIQDRLGIIVISIVKAIYGSATSTILTCNKIFKYFLMLLVSEDRKVFLRERGNKLYSVIAYFIAKTTAEFPVFFISYCSYCAILYHTANLNDTYSWRYYVFIAIFLLSSFVGSGYSFLVGSLVENEESLTSLSAAILLPLLLLSGFFASADNYAPYLKPLEYLSGFKYSYQILINMEFTDIQPLNCMNSLKSPCDPMAQQFNFKEDLWISCVCLFLCFLLFKTLAYIFTYRRSKMKA